ncbi:MAG: hypothetical protein ABGZ53_08180 [Fuerstiella sp.]
MDELLLDFIIFELSLGQQTEIVCPSCEMEYLLLDTVEDEYRCEQCGSTFIDSDTEDE